MDVKTEKAPMVAALLAVFWALGAPAAVEASLPLDAPSSVFKTADPFATAPQLDLPSLTEQLRAVEERRAAASDCVALCELAAGIEARPFGPAVSVLPNRSEDAWGNYRFTSELETSHNRFGFTGHYWDKEASLYYAKARYYDPFTARFTQADSFLGSIDDPPSLHRYQYANDNPTLFVDLSGHDAAMIESELAQAGTPSWGGRFLTAWPGAIAATVTEGLAATGRFGLRVLTSLQRPGSTADQFNERIPELRRLNQGDLDAIKDEASFYHHTLANISETGPEAIDAARDLGPEASAGVIAGATVSTLGAIETGAGLVRGGMRMVSGQSRGIGPSTRASTTANYESFGGETLDDALRMKEQPFSPKSGSPTQLTAGRAWEDAELASLGKNKNTNVWRPSAADINSAAFKVIVGPAKYTKGGLPIGTTVDIAETAGSVEIKGGTKVMESSYQLRLQTYRALKMENPLTIRTTRPINGVFSDWLKRWGVKVENPSAAAGTAPPGAP